MLDKLEIHHLRTLSALYKFKNISAAAEHLCISQQAVSLQLKKIREIVQDPLFVRSGHGMTPTAYAAVLESHVQNILSSFNQIPLPDSMTPHETERTLVVSATDYTQKVVVSELFKHLRADAPRVKLIVRNIEGADLIRKMNLGEINLVLTSHGYVPDGLRTRSLFTEKYVCVSANKKLAGNEMLSIKELAVYDFVVVTPGSPSFRGSADTWFEQQGAPRRVVLSLPSFFMALEYLKQTDLVGFVPSRLLPYEGLFTIPLEKHPPGYEVVAAYHPSAESDRLLMGLLDRVQ